MPNIDSFDAISPLDYRYADKALQEFLSENARVRYEARVEAALARVLARRGVCTKEIADEIAKAAETINAQEVYAEEAITKHDIRALVNCIRNKVSEKAKPYAHFSATSYDIVDTANALRYKDAVKEVLIPNLNALEKTLIELALAYKNSLQMGRTHGQHAEPITFGFALSYYVSRLGKRIKTIENSANELAGKFSGAVGAYNASSLLVSDPLQFEKEIMDELQLKVSEASTQIAEPEPIADLIHALISCFSVLANLADDMRNLQRSEIAEVGEAFEAKQVGSSTMPHKRNPINFENVKSLYKQFMPRIITVYLDQISEHQRDLTNSASQRFTGEIIAGLNEAVKRLNRTCGKLAIDSSRMIENFNKSKEMIVAEPLYILLAFYGHPDAHEHVKKLTLDAGKNGKKLNELALEDASLQSYLKKFTEQQKEIIENPEKYIGIAAEKTEKICNHWKGELKL